MPRRRGEAGGPSLEGLAGGVVGLTVSYLGAEAALANGDLHPVHWGIAVLGGGIGYAVGHAVYLTKERRHRRPMAPVRRGHDRPPPGPRTGSSGRRPRRRRR